MSLPEVVMHPTPQYGIQLPYRVEATGHSREEIGLVFIPMATLELLTDQAVATHYTAYSVIGYYESVALTQAGYTEQMVNAVQGTPKLVEEYPHLYLSFENAVDAEAARIRKSKKRKPREATIQLDEGLKNRLQTNNDQMTLPILDVSVFKDLGA